MTAIKVPPLGESIVEATISRWLKNEGDAVSPGETLVELETDKITVDVPVMATGVLKKRLKNEGDVVKVDEVLAEIEEGAQAAGGGPPVAEKPKAAAPAPAAPSPTGDTRVSPAAAREAASRGVDPASLKGTGRAGVVSKADVIESASTKPASSTPSQPATRSPQPVPPGERETREKMTTRRKKIAEHLLESQHATAHLTTFNEIDMSAVNALRERHRERIEKETGVKLSLMPFFVRAAVQALKTYPVVNAQIDGDSIIYKHYVNMGIAVASDAGLVVPNIKDADRKSMVDIGKDIVAIAKRAREGKLTMDDLTGGTFTITNGGVFGSLVSTPIINYPQVGILGLHKTQDRPIAVAGKVEIRPMMYVALSYDHRVIDGQQAVLFLVRVKELMEDPGAMLLG
jgi:2-oxoglutarate dehydrogenase E2 component (dihydrolipoamide succinyltransferase)